MKKTLKQDGYSNEAGETDPKKNIREKINLLLPDGLMIVLAIIMAPIVLVPIFITLPTELDTFFKYADYFILSIFILEYILKTIYAPNVIKHIINPWHVLDLIIIVLPLITLLPVFASDFGLSFPVLRLVRIFRIFALGGRALDRKIAMSAPGQEAREVSKPPSEIQVINRNLESVFKDIQFNRLRDFLAGSANAWVNICGITEQDYDRLSNIFGIPRILLESELVDEAFPRIDHFENSSMIFARVANLKNADKGPGKIAVDRDSLLVICQGQNIMTLSKTPTHMFDLILEKAKKFHTSQEPLVVTILYTLLRHVLDKDKQIITALEQELIRLESTPFKDSPSNFLEITFALRKEINQVVPSLMHLKEIISEITTKRVAMEGFDERHEKVFDILMDEASYLHESAVSVKDNLESLIDLYINTTSHEMNKVMRLIAVLTVLGIIPAIILGALGTNVSGNPWGIQLWQVFTVPLVLMLVLGWVFYRLGWLKW